MAKASDNPFPSVLAVEGTAPASPSAGQQRLYIDSADHKLKRKDSSGTVVTVESSGSLTVQDENSNVSTSVTQIDFQGAGVTASAGTGEVVVTIPGGGAGTKLNVVNSVAGNVSTSLGTSWAAVNSTTWDVSLAAVAGDYICCGWEGRAIAGVDNLWIDMFTVISGTMTTSWATGAALNNAHAGMLIAAPSGTVSGASRVRACGSGDLDSGIIKFRLAWRNNGSTASPTMCASTASAPLNIWVANYGQ